MADLSATVSPGRSPRSLPNCLPSSPPPAAHRSADKIKPLILGTGPSPPSPARRRAARCAHNDRMTAPQDVPAVTLPGGGRMPLVGFGTWKLRNEQARDGVRAALATGYRHLDTATMYANE